MDKSIQKFLKVVEEQLSPFLSFVLQIDAMLFAFFLRNFHSSVTVAGFFFQVWKTNVSGSLILGVGSLSLDRIFFILDRFFACQA